MGLLSRFEGKMEDTVEGAADRMGAAPLSPVQIAKKAEKQMRREKMVGAGKQYAPTLYTVLVNADDDRRLLGYYPTLAGETETYLSAKAAEQGLVMDGQPLVRFIVDDDLRHGKFDVIAEMVASPLVEQLRQEEYARYGILRPQGQGAMGRAAAPAGYQAGYQPAPAPAPAPKPQTMNFNQMADDYDFVPEDTEGRQAYIYDITNDRAFTLPGDAETIGRESKNDIVIPDINVSRVHAEIRQDESGAWILTDLGSTNGTFVNGRQIKSTALQDADRIIVGTTNLEFQLI
ncbi:FhaA domain-containing protein [Adlercreutzia mucosicola]|uniref:DUF3662 domain-containing protein n=1 Tax=Adlercreutzia mucosicola TaxID=580026 RepID=A0A6N8JN01_9ACTN|nr:DUF3662 and FHA domain-containing protein [Adlercreutzia mucosicola]MCI9494542.1 DUF3662 domain-containing protein [Adlercreutzia mucosicola]MCR2035940.1 DUF3662 and FHA domain-containing protein [Adlercreutzia mucosicola]MEB1813104.1 DUF3662 and FHA domain-containing protein [Adlercreutzia mucosicola]MVX60210.1 DUF3662 domain-containing protein [Adlercreutzia mucosicola]